MTGLFNWLRTRQARKTFTAMLDFHEANRHRFTAEENAYFVLSMNMAYDVRNGRR